MNQPNKKLNLKRETLKNLGVKSGVKTGAGSSPVMNSVGVHVSTHVESLPSGGVVFTTGGFGFGGGGGGG